MTVQIIVIIVLGISVGALAFFVIRSLFSEKKIDVVEKLIKQGKTAAAIKTAKAVIAKNSRDFTAHYYLGLAYLADNKQELALMEFKTVNQNAIFNEGIPEIEFRKTIAQLYLKYNQPEEAIKEFLLLTKLEPRNPENFFQAAKLFEYRDKSEQALQYYKQTIQLDKKHVKAHAALGLLLFRAKQYQEAKKEIDLAISLSPETFSSYYYLGKILKENKAYADAVAAFEKALRDPEFKQRALLERGSCYLAANHVEKAITEFERAIAASRDDGSQETLYARYFLAACYEKTRKLDLAIIQWEKIFAKSRNFRDVSAKLAEYQDLQANDHMKEYLTSSSDAFIEICKKVALKGFNLAAKDCQSTKYGCKIMAVDAKSENWMGVRQQQQLVFFYRDADDIEESVLRHLSEEMKQKNISKSIICTNTGFSRSALVFAENRPIELIGKDKLDQLLSLAG